MNKLHIKPLPISKAFQGRWFKTKLCKDYEEDVGYLLPKLKAPKGKLFLRLEFGFSSKNSDLDNPVKIFVDILQKKYEFNDKQIYLMEVAKEDVKKGEEYIAFDISVLE